MCVKNRPDMNSCGFKNVKVSINNYYVGHCYKIFVRPTQILELIYKIIHFFIIGCVSSLYLPLYNNKLLNLR